MKTYNQFINEGIFNISDKYAIELDKNRFEDILGENCISYNKNGVTFYRGDRKLNGEYYLVNGGKTVTQLKYDYNYITTEFISSDLWKDKGYPLKKHSLNMSTNRELSDTFGDGSYMVIPFDNAKIVCLPREFGVCPNRVLEKELNIFEQPFSLAAHLAVKSGFDKFNLSNISDVIKKLENIYNNKDVKNKGDEQIISNMEKHNMSFKEYMEFVFAPENYDVFDYDDITKLIVKKYTAGYTDSKVLMVKMEKLNENVTSTGRWGHVGAGVLPYCSETKRFLISFRSEYVMEPHTWGIWGGKVDDEDMNNIEETAIREFQEETRYDGDIKLIPSYIYREKGFTYYNFIGVVKKEFQPDLDWINEKGFEETEDYEWITLDDLLKIKPKHFGLIALINNNLEQLKNI